MEGKTAPIIFFLKRAEHGLEDSKTQKKAAGENTKKRKIDSKNVVAKPCCDSLSIPEKKRKIDSKNVVAKPCSDSLSIPEKKSCVMITQIKEVLGKECSSLKTGKGELGSSSSDMSINSSSSDMSVKSEKESCEVCCIQPQAIEVLKILKIPKDSLLLKQLNTCKSIPLRETKVRFVSTDKGKDNHANSRASLTHPFLNMATSITGKKSEETFCPNKKCPSVQKEDEKETIKPRNCLYLSPLLPEEGEVDLEVANPWFSKELSADIPEDDLMEKRKYDDDDDELLLSTHDPVLSMIHL